MPGETGAGWGSAGSGREVSGSGGLGGGVSAGLSEEGMGPDSRRLVGMKSAYPTRGWAERRGSSARRNRTIQGLDAVGVGGRWPGLVSGATGAAPLLLELRLEHVATPTHLLALEAADLVEHRAVVEAVELLDDLERPAPVEDVATDDLLAHSRRVARVTAPIELIGRIPEEQVSAPDELVEGVQVASCSFDVLEGLGRLADRLHQRVRRPFRTATGSPAGHDATAEEHASTLGADGRILGKRWRAGQRNGSRSIGGPFGSVTTVLPTRNVM